MLSALILFAQTARAIDFDHGGAPVKRVVEGMAEAYGESATADGTMQRDYLILALRHETFESAKQLIAKTLNASWTEKDGTWILNRNRVQESQDKDTEIAYWREAYKDVQREIKVPPRLAGDSATKLVQEVVRLEALEPLAYPQHLLAMLPGQRAVAKIISLFKPEELARMPPNATLPFDVSGKRGLRALPKGSRQILQEFVSDQNALANVMEMRGGLTVPLHGMERLSPDVDSIVFTLRCTSGIVGAKLFCGVADEQFNIVFDSDFSGRTPTRLNQWPRGLEAKAVYSGTARKKLAMRPFWGFAPVEATEPDPALFKMYTSPATHDPLELAVSEVVRQSADALHKSMCVQVAEYAGAFETRLGRGEYSLAQALETLFPGLIFNLQIDEHSLIVRSNEPATMRRQFYGRLELADTINALRARSPHTLDSLAGLAATNHPYFSMPTTALSAMSGAIFGMMRRTNASALALYSDLDAQQKQSAQRGYVDISPLALDDTSALAVADLYANSLTFSDPQDFGVNDGDYSSFNLSRVRLRTINLRQSRIRVRIRNQSTLFTIGSDARDTVPLQPFTLSQAAEGAAWRDVKGVDLGAVTLFRMVAERGVIVSLVSGGAEAVIGASFLPATYAGDEFVTIDKLPDDVRREYKRLYDIKVKELKGGVSVVPSTWGRSREGAASQPHSCTLLNDKVKPC